MSRKLLVVLLVLLACAHQAGEQAEKPAGQAVSSGAAAESPAGQPAAGARTAAGAPAAIEPFEINAAQMRGRELRTAVTMGTGR